MDNQNIKEILNRLEIVARIHTIEVCEDGSKIEIMPASVVDELRLNNYSAKILLDCITNLQEKYDIAQKDIEVLKNNYNDLVKMSENKINILQEENDMFKVRCDYLQRSCERKEKQMLDYRMEYMEQEDYKSRCEKAIEYIKENKNKTFLPYGDNEDTDYEICLFEEDIAILLNILQGEDKE